MSMNDATPKPARTPVTSDKAVKTILASRLLGVAKVMVIEHKGERYALRLTRNDKLILTK